MSEVVDLSLARARVAAAGDCRKWTVVDALKCILSRIESGEIKPDKVFIAMAEPTEDGMTSFYHELAGCSRLECMGLLYENLNHMCAGPFEGDSFD